MRNETIDENAPLEEYLGTYQVVGYLQFDSETDCFGIWATFKKFATTIILILMHVRYFPFSLPSACSPCKTRTLSKNEQQSELEAL